MKRLVSKLILCTALCTLILAFTSCLDFLNNENETPDHICKYEKEIAQEQYLKSLATCTKKAVYYKSCECGKKGISTFEYGEVNPHAFDRKINTGAYLKENATCKIPGVYYKSCVCGAIGTETFLGEELGAHDYQNGTCTVCQELYGTKTLKFELNSDGQSYTVTGIEGTDATEIFIPESYEGKPVTEIGENAFKNLSVLRSIELPAGITKIGNAAFSGCRALQKITYFGTVAQWNSITKNSGWNSDSGDYTIKCSNGNVNKDNKPIELPMLPA